MARRQHYCTQDDIDDILFGSDEGENELDEIEPELMFDSDDDTEYVADPTELQKDSESSDSEEYVTRKRKQKRPLSKRAKRSRHPPSTCSSASHATHAADPTTSTADPATSTADPATSTADPATSTADPATSTADPATSTADPATSTADPATSTADPATSTADSGYPAPAPAYLDSDDPDDPAPITPAASVDPAAAVAPAPAAAAAPATRRRPGRRRQRQDDDEDMVVIFREATVKSKSGYVWHTKPQVAGATRTAVRNIVGPFRPGPTQVAAQATTPEQCFRLFITNEIVNIVVEWTNVKIDQVARKYKNKTATVRPTTATEIRALLGVLVFSGYRKDNHLNTKELWCPVAGAPFYRAAMSEGRFSFLIYCLRFDDMDTREERRVDDNLAPIRSVWDMFMAACEKHYTPHEYLTVDEQLLAFRGNCPFRMYIPNKPAKYGIKIVMANDVESKYLLKGIPYLGRRGSQPRDGLQLGHIFTRDLTRPYHNTNRNVTTDNWFTSVPLAQDMLHNCGMTIVGTLRANKSEIPEVMKDKNSRRNGTSAFMFTKDMTLVSHIPSKQTQNKKNVLLLSTMHTQPTVSIENGNPEIIDFYNGTKGGVDTFDQMCAQYSCSRKTNRWPMCMFYGMINAAVINSWVIFKANNDRVGGKKMKRRKYMHEMALQLIKPNAQQRLNAPTQHKHVKAIITQVCSINPSGMVADAGPSAAEMREPMVRCKKCESKADKKTRFRCHSCRQPVCPSHYYPYCCDCV